jgi:hypothetical protein
VIYDAGVSTRAHRVELADDAVAVDLHGPAIILATRGAVRVSDHAGTDGAVELRPGDAVYVAGAPRARSRVAARPSSPSPAAADRPPGGERDRDTPMSAR